MKKRITTHTAQVSGSSGFLIMVRCPCGFSLVKCTLRLERSSHLNCQYQTTQFSCLEYRLVMNTLALDNVPHALECRSKTRNQPELR